MNAIYSIICQCTKNRKNCDSNLWKTFPTCGVFHFSGTLFSSSDDQDGFWIGYVLLTKAQNSSFKASPLKRRIRFQFVNSTCHHSVIYRTYSFPLNFSTKVEAKYRMSDQHEAILILSLLLDILKGPPKPPFFHSMEAV